jgi:hypothetical protein
MKKLCLVAMDTDVRKVTQLPKGKALVPALRSVQRFKPKAVD